MAVIPSGGRPQALSHFKEADAGNYLVDALHIQEDIGWTNLTQDPYGYQTALDFSPTDRKLQVTRARHCWRTFPLAKQAIRLYCTYVLGQGISVHHADERAQEILDAFWDDYDNQIALTAPGAMATALSRQRIDGELFLSLFTDPETGRVKVRVLDPLQMEEVISDSEDETRPLYYQRRWTPRLFHYTSDQQVPTYLPGPQRIVYYADAANATLPDAPPTLEQARVIHDRINALGRRGVSDLYAALDWIEAHRTFMEDRASLTHALANVAWTMKVKGGPPHVAAARQALGSSLSGPSGLVSAGWETNPPAASAATFIANEGATLSPMTVETGAANAETDGRMLVVQVGAATGIMLHYFGDGGDANLATATAMDLPMLKMFEEGQTHWGGLMTRVCQYVLVQAIKAGELAGWRVEVQDNAEVAVPPTPEAGGLDIDFPLIVQRDTWAMTQSLAVMRGAGFISTKTGAKESSILLGLDDIDAAIDEALAEKEEAQAHMAASLQRPATNATDRAAPQGPTTPAENAANPVPETERPTSTTRP